MRKIKFQVLIADDFYFPAKDMATNAHLWPIAIGKSDMVDIEIEFEPSGEKGVMKDAEDALRTAKWNDAATAAIRIYSLCKFLRDHLPPFS